MDLPPAIGESFVTGLAWNAAQCDQLYNRVMAPYEGPTGLTGDVARFSGGITKLVVNSEGYTLDPVGDPNICAEYLRSLVQKTGILHIQISDTSPASHLGIRTKSATTTLTSSDSTLVVVRQKSVSVRCKGFSPHSQLELGENIQVFMPKNRFLDPTNWLRTIVAIDQEFGSVKLVNSSEALQGYELFNMALNGVFAYASQHGHALRQLQDPEAGVGLPPVQLPQIRGQLHLRSFGTDTNVIHFENQEDEPDDRQDLLLAQHPDGAVTISRTKPNCVITSDDSEYAEHAAQVREVVSNYFKALGVTLGKEDFIRNGVLATRQMLRKHSLRKVQAMLRPDDY